MQKSFTIFYLHLSKLCILVLTHHWDFCPTKQMKTRWFQELGPGYVKTVMYFVSGFSTLTFEPVSVIYSTFSRLIELVI